MQEAALSKVEQMPQNWDGHELRLYLADKFHFEISHIMRNGRSARVREYRRVIANSNL